MTELDRVAAGLATALLGGAWEQAEMRRRVIAALGRPASGSRPRWVVQLATQVTAAYRDAPRDRPRELAAFIQTTPAWARAWSGPRPPRIVHWAPEPTAMGHQPWPITPLPDLGALARLLDLDQGELAWFADLRGMERTCAEPLRHYRWRMLPKRGGVRLVAAPKPRLKEIQRRLLRHVFGLIPTHHAAHGCVVGRSVASAVAPHTQATVVIRADLEAFFAGVGAGRVWGLLRLAGLPEAVAHTVTGLVTTVVPEQVWRALPVPADRGAHRRLGARLRVPHLPQGAPSSPAVANLAAFALDRRLAGVADRFDAHYTRYVDDLSFSGGPSLRSARSRFVSLVESIVAAEGWRLNDRKTVVLGSSGRQQVLGCVVNDHPTLPRRERDNLRALLHNCAVHGWASQARGLPQDQFRAQLLGRVSWAGGVDPVLGARLRARFEAISWP